MFLEASKCHLHLFIYIVLLCSINPQLKFTVVPSCEDLILRGFPDPLCLLPQPQDLTQTWGVQALQLAVANEPLFLIFLGRHSSDSDPVKSRPWQIAMWHPFSRTNDTAVVKTAGNLIWPMTFLKKKSVPYRLKMSQVASLSPQMLADASHPNNTNQSRWSRDQIHWKILIN